MRTVKWKLLIDIYIFYAWIANYIYMQCGNNWWKRTRFSFEHTTTNTNHLFLDEFSDEAGKYAFHFHQDCSSQHRLPSADSEGYVPTSIFTENQKFRSVIQFLIWPFNCYFIHSIEKWMIDHIEYIFGSSAKSFLVGDIWIFAFDPLDLLPKIKKN